MVRLLYSDGSLRSDAEWVGLRRSIDQSVARDRDTRSFKSSSRIAAATPRRYVSCACGAHAGPGSPHVRRRGRVRHFRALARPGSTAALLPSRQGRPSVAMDGEPSGEDAGGLPTPVRGGRADLAAPAECGADAGARIGNLTRDGSKQRLGHLDRSTPVRKRRTVSLRGAGLHCGCRSEIPRTWSDPDRQKTTADRAWTVEPMLPNSRLSEAGSIVGIEGKVVVITGATCKSAAC